MVQGRTFEGMMRRARHSLGWYAPIALVAAAFLTMVSLIAADTLARSGGPPPSQPPMIAATTVAPATSTSEQTTTSAPTTTTSSTTTTVAPTTSVSNTTTTKAAAPAPVPTTAPAAPPATAPVYGFATDLAMGHIQALAEGIGPRRSGSAAEDAAFGYATEYLRSLGYQVETTEVPLPNGKMSHNVQVVKPGTSSATIVVGGHIDTASGAPGANDNASGPAVILELAHYLKGVQTLPTIVLVCFGAEEMVGSSHHFGSRKYVADMSAEERSALVAMISLDMVIYGTDFKVRTMRRGPQLLSDMLLAYSARNSLGMRFLKDTGTTGMSDHEPFELAGYPAAWVEWRADPTYHTAGDNWDHVKSKSDQLRITGETMLGFLLSLTEADIAALAAARTF